MKPLVSKTLMDRAWLKVGGSTGAAALELQKRCSREQDELARSVTVALNEFREEANGLGLYAYVVISEAFRQTGARFRTIKLAKILPTMEATSTQVMERDLEDRASARTLIDTASEPEVLDYILECLSADDDNSVALTDEEFWALVAILKSASDCLHDAVKPERQFHVVR